MHIHTSSNYRNFDRIMNEDTSLYSCTKKHLSENVCRNNYICEDITCIYTYIHRQCIHAHACIFACMWSCTHTWSFLVMYLYISHIKLHAQLNIVMCQFLYIYIYIYIYIYTYTRMHMDMHAYMVMFGYVFKDISHT